MENATEALMMGFAVLIFVIALTVGITVFSQVKGVSDIVLYSSDKTSYYDYQEAEGKASQNRIVGLETIIPTLYKYYKENYTVLFRQGTYNEETGEFGKTTYLPIYKTPSKYETGTTMLWGKNYDTIMKNKYTPYLEGGYNKKGNNEIFSFDLEEETLRHEPWTGSYDKTKENIDCMLYGNVYKNPNNNSDYIKYYESPLMNGGFIAKYKNRKFVETVGEYTYSSSQASETEEGSSISSLVKPKTKRVIIYTLITNK